MIMGQDARVRYTKMMIQVNFVELLKKKPLNKITVKEICELAEINRATFYRYYADAYDVLDKMEDAILQELQGVIQASARDDVTKMLVRMLEKIKDDGALYIALFSDNGDTRFPMKIFKLCYAEFEETIRKKIPQLTETQRVWTYSYIAQGSSGILNYWISDGMAETPEEVAGFIARLVSGTIKNI